MNDQEDLRAICGPRASALLPAPGPASTMNDCTFCHYPMWVGPDHRTLIVEWELAEIEYILACEPCVAEFPNTESNDAGNEASRLKLLRGELPESRLVIANGLEDLHIIEQQFQGYPGIRVKWL
jgi:hypothetical protein